MSAFVSGTKMEPNGSMNGFKEAARAYAASSRRRSIREQEAEIFRDVNSALRRGQSSGGTTRVRALADTVRLWTAVVDLVGDPENALPPDLRASIISIGFTVKREAQLDDPDFEFLIAVNENIAAGLATQG